MRHDQADEANHAGHRCAAADDQPDAECKLPLRSIHIDTERTSARVTERQCVECATTAKHCDTAEDDQRSSDRKFIEAAIGESAQHPTHDLTGCPWARRK